MPVRIIIHETDKNLVKYAKNSEELPKLYRFIKKKLYKEAKLKKDNNTCIKHLKKKMTPRQIRLLHSRMDLDWDYSIQAMSQMYGGMTKIKEFDHLSKQNPYIDVIDENYWQMKI